MRKLTKFSKSDAYIHTVVNVVKVCGCYCKMFMDNTFSQLNVVHSTKKQLQSIVSSATAIYRKTKFSQQMIVV